MKNILKNNYYYNIKNNYGLNDKPNIQRTNTFYLLSCFYENTKKKRGERYRVILKGNELLICHKLKVHRSVTRVNNIHFNLCNIFKHL